MAPVTVIVSVPSMLHGCTDGRPEVEVTASTLAEAIEALVTEFPLLRNNLFQEDGSLRRHVWIFYNDENTRWIDNLDLPLQTGDRLTVLQAVSGG